MQNSKPEPRPFVIATSSGEDVAVKCPVCAYDKFITARPKIDEDGIGFRHVIVGQSLSGDQPLQFLALPVRFKACANCGYVLKFMLTDQANGEEQ